MDKNKLNELIETAENMTDSTDYEILLSLIRKCTELNIPDTERDDYIIAVNESIALSEVDVNLYDELLKQGHILIAGASGSGKSVVINGFICNILNTYGLDCELLLLDPKLVELSTYKNLPQTLAYSDNPSGMIKVLETAIVVIENRYKKMQRNNLKKYTEHPIFVIIDEFADLMTTNKKKALPLCQRIAQVGRACNVHLVVATQDTTKKTMDTVKNNLTCKVALKTATRYESQNIIGVKGAETLPKYGKCILDTGIEQKIVNVPYIDDNEITETVNQFNGYKSLLCHLSNRIY